MPQLRDITGNWFSDPSLVISSGQLRGVTHVNKFGHNASIAACTTEDIWDNGSTYVFPTQARIHNIASSSDLDTACGTGARTVKIFGLDTDYNEIDETVILSGTCNVPTVNEYLRVFRMIVDTGGSTGQAQGNISATAVTDATISAIIRADEGNQTHMAIYTVPAGKKGYITHIFGSIGRQQPATFTLDFQDKGSHTDSVFNSVFTIDGNTTGSSFVTYFPHPYIVVPEKHDVKIIGSGSAANIDIVAGFDIILM